MEIIETALFEQEARQIFADDEYLSLINHIAVYPDSGKVIPGGGGIILLRAYAKNVTDDLSAEQLTRLKRSIKG